ncbi:MAG: hypothetical protein HN352_08340 [Bacteroidetes bacterium]|jgi:hypothetical protein|nr:hypothetical protein [Bacteroidota bacterium]MBT3749754.1 hypothetical protein [Bacteroidota bacterium]MBT4400711.1 hypothetical protein [Bacteroidota bacterium]MBT4408225.1 hypothetical protein [Bacteroidota bacterium]MBT5425407.1 hypothetical protein [Bacteroidota bacterium]
MNTTRIILLSILMSLPVFQSQAQNQTDEILSSVLLKFDEIAGFEADALIKVDVDFINIKDREVKISFTSPDKFDFDIKGLALLPKNGFKMEYMDLLRSEYTAINAGPESIREQNTVIIKLIPESIDSDIILAQLWIDPVLARIVRMKTFTRSSGSYLIDFFFGSPDIILPNKLEVVFDIKNINMLPGSMMNDLMSDGKLKDDSVPDEAKVTVEYNNLQITKK